MQQEVQSRYTHANKEGAIVSDVKYEHFCPKRTGKKKRGSLRTIRKDTVDLQMVARKTQQIFGPSYSSQKAPNLNCLLSFLKISELSVFKLSKLKRVLQKH